MARKASLADWRTITNDREKYAAYLCSREWAEKREKVRERACGHCERCLVFPMEACHHLTYERKYNEKLDDLQAICTRCHEFTHGKSDDDPSRFHREMRIYLARCVSCKTRPLPWDYMVDGYARLTPWLASTLKAIDILQIALEYDEGSFGPLVTLQESLPFLYCSRFMPRSRFLDPMEYVQALACFGLPGTDQAWLETETED